MKNKSYFQHPLAKIKRKAADFSVWLDGATISAVDWIAPRLTVENEAAADGIPSAILSGVEEGESYEVTVRVTASDGRQKDYSFTLVGSVIPLDTVNKDPDDAINLAVDYGSALDGATKTGRSWDVPGGIIQVAASHTDTKEIVRVSGGTKGETYRITNLADLSNGERLAGVIDVYIVSA